MGIAFIPRKNYLKELIEIPNNSRTKNSLPIFQIT